MSPIIFSAIYLRKKKAKFFLYTNFCCLSRIFTLFSFIVTTKLLAKFTGQGYAHVYDLNVKNVAYI